MPTLTFCCGGECGIVGTGVAPGAGGVRHWDTVTGVPTIETSGAIRSGARVYRFTTAAGAAIDIRKSLAAPTLVVGRCYVQFEGSLPSADCAILCIGVAAGAFPQIRFQFSDTKLYAAVGANLGATGITVVAETWYRIDFRADVAGAGSTRTMELQVDGVAAGTASVSAAASTLTSSRYGVNANTGSALTTANATLRVDDIALSQTTGDYPLGAGKVLGLVPNADGTHVFDTAGDFKYNDTTNIPTSATDVYSYLDDPLDNITDFIACPAASNTEYVEVQFSNTTGDVGTVNGVEVVMASHASAGAANKQTLRLNDAGTLSDVCTDLDQSQVTITYHSKHYATAPSTGTAWTPGQLDALKARWNSSYGTPVESPVPYLDGLALEVDYVIAPPRFLTVQFRSAV